MSASQAKNRNNHSLFGPFRLNLLPRLHIEDVTVESQSNVLQFFGNNGSGKSTILELIRQELNSKGKNYSYLNQDYRSSWLWWKTAHQNLELSYHNINDNESYIESDLYKRPRSWLEPILSEKPKSVFFENQPELATVQLSGGQLQRLIVFRELLHKPDYLLLDEAFSALDSDITSDIIEMIKHEQSLRHFVIISIAHSEQVQELLGGDIFQFEVDPKTKKLKLIKQSN